MKRTHLLFAAWLLACSACGSSTTEQPKSTSKDEVGTPLTSKRFRGAMAVDVAPLGDRPVANQRDLFALAARNHMADVLACLRPLPARPTSLWFTGRVREDGNFKDIVVTGDVPADVAECARTVMLGVHVAPADPTALSVVLWAEPAPDGCVADDCKAMPVASAPADPRSDREKQLEEEMAMLGGQTPPLVGLGSRGSASASSTGQGFGTGTGRLGGPHKAPPTPSAVAGAHGSLPAEEIQRIVRKSFSRLRICYENGLRTNPNLAGLVKVAFIIDREGNVGSAVDDKSDLADANVVACVVDAIKKLSFPKPEGGIVKVTYPIQFSPGDDDAPPATTPLAKAAAGGLKIGGASFTSVDGAKAAGKLTQAGWLTATVPAKKPGDRFVVFAFKGGALPTARPVGFLTSVRAEPMSAPLPKVSAESDDVRFAAEGFDPHGLMDDLVDGNSKAAK